MAEIKSTMDIIMEKVKGLTMTEGERESFKKQELEKRVKILVQKFVNGAMSMEKLFASFNDIEDCPEELLNVSVIEECAARITLGGENKLLLEILDNVPGFEASSIREILHAFEFDLEDKRKKFLAAASKRLKDNGISGSAVIPNLNSDTEWDRVIADTEREFSVRLRRMLKEMKK